LLRNWEPGAVALNREGGYTVVLIPNGPFQRCEAIDAFIGRRLPGTTALNLIKSYVSCSGQDVIERIVKLAQLASAHLVELARLAVTTGGERAEAAESSSIAKARLRVALELIARRHCEPDLCVNDIAAAQDRFSPLPAEAAREKRHLLL